MPQNEGHTYIHSHKTNLITKFWNLLFLMNIISQSYESVQWAILLKLTNFQHQGLHSASTWKMLLWHQPHMVGDQAGTIRNRRLTAVLLSCRIHLVGEFPEIVWVLSVGSEHIPAINIHSHGNSTLTIHSHGSLTVLWWEAFHLNRVFMTGFAILQENIP